MPMRRSSLQVEGAEGADRRMQQCPPVQAPNASAHAERWIRTVRAECLDWLLIVGRGHLEQVLRVYVEHYNGHRPHRALRLEPPDPSADQTSSASIRGSGCTDVTCFAVSSTSTDELHERICAPYGVEIEKLVRAAYAARSAYAHGGDRVEIDLPMLRRIVRRCLLTRLIVGDSTPDGPRHKVADRALLSHEELQRSIREPFAEFAQRPRNLLKIARSSGRHV
jgi:Integrase core domain